MRQAVKNALIFGDGLQMPTPATTSSIQAADDDDVETTEGFKQRLIYVLGQMMFVSGETAEPSPETTWMIEEIVREQVVEMVKLPSSTSILATMLTHAM